MGKPCGHSNYARDIAESEIRKRLHRSARDGVRRTMCGSNDALKHMFFRDAALK